MIAVSQRANGIAPGALIRFFHAINWKEFAGRGAVAEIDRISMKFQHAENIGPNTAAERSGALSETI